MKIVIVGGTGFLGWALARTLVADGHQVVQMSRHVPTVPTPGRHVVWQPDGGVGPWAVEVDGADALVNLAGESIARHRWSAAQKRRILESRVLSTRSVIESIKRASVAPSVLISGSAVGYYGPLDDQFVTEDTGAGRDFLADVCVRWEAEAVNASTRVVCIRTGIALERDGGALPQMLPPFWLGFGGPAGSGRQYWPWIHREDWIDLVRFAIVDHTVAGPINATAPNPVTNREFATALGRAMHRPSFMPAPGFALKLLLGEMAESLLLSGQRAVPAKAGKLGFKFKYETLESALSDLFKS